MVASTLGIIVTDSYMRCCEWALTSKTAHAHTSKATTLISALPWQRTAGRILKDLDIGRFQDLQCEQLFSSRLEVLVTHFSGIQLNAVGYPRPCSRLLFKLR